MAMGHLKAGQFNLHGKRSRLMSCRCCVLRDLRVRRDERAVEKFLREGKWD